MLFRSLPPVVASNYENWVHRQVAHQAGRNVGQQEDGYVDPDKDEGRIELSILKRPLENGLIAHPCKNTVCLVGGQGAAAAVAWVLLHAVALAPRGGSMPIIDMPLE